LSGLDLGQTGLGGVGGAGSEFISKYKEKNLYKCEQTMYIRRRKKTREDQHPEDPMTPMTPITEDVTLNPRQEAFCLAYVHSGNAASAARVAGYETAGARQQGYRLLQTPAVVRRLGEIRATLARDGCRDTEQLLGKLENIYARALEEHQFAAAARAVAVQARIAGLMPSMLERIAAASRPPGPRFKMLTDVDNPSTSGLAGPVESRGCTPPVDTAPGASTTPSKTASTRVPDDDKVGRH